MSIQSDFSTYLTVDGYLCPNPVPAGTVRGSDNQPMFTSEYYIILERNGVAVASDYQKYISLITACVGTDKALHRSPGDTSSDEIDDNLAVLAAYAEFGFKVPFNLPLVLWRFPQLVYAYLLNKGVPALLLAPLGFITAIILGISCIGTPINQADPRRLNWLLWQATKRHSIICNLAGKFWHWRQQKAYGTSNVMPAVAGYYYYPLGLDNNPYSKYWKD